MRKQCEEGPQVHRSTYVSNVPRYLNHEMYVGRSTVSPLVQGLYISWHITTSATAINLKPRTRKIRNLASAEPCATSKYEVVVVGYLIYYIISIISATSKYEVVGYLIYYY